MSELDRENFNPTSLGTMGNLMSHKYLAMFGRIEEAEQALKTYKEIEALVPDEPKPLKLLGWTIQIHTGIGLDGTNTVDLAKKMIENYQVIAGNDILVSTLC
jgi:hypothetical protein